MAKKVDIIIVKTDGDFNTVKDFRQAMKVAIGGDRSLAIKDAISDARINLKFFNEYHILVNPTSLKISRIWSRKAWNLWSTTILLEEVKDSLENAGFDITESVTDVSLPELENENKKTTSIT